MLKHKKVSTYFDTGGSYGTLYYYNYNWKTAISKRYEA